MAEPAPLPLSVVIPTRDRRARRVATLNALALQSLAADRFEVIVAIDAGTDDTASVLDATPWPFRLRHVLSASRGAAAARNTGAAIATGERLVFLDDDITVDPGFLSAHLAAAAEVPGAAIVGNSVPIGLARDWFGQSVAAWWNGRFGAMAAPDYRFGHTDVMSGNLSVPREVFARLGGFDASLQCREDYEFGYRLVRADVPIRYCAGARGLHSDASDPRRNLRRAEAEGKADLQIARKYADLFAWLRAANMTADTRGAGALRLLTFRMPGFARLLLSFALRLQAMTGFLGLKRAWSRLNGMARALSYHLGVAGEAGTPAPLFALRDKARRSAPPEWLDLDLANAARSLRRKVSATRPDALLLWRNGTVIDEIWAEPGRERLEPRHLDACLARIARDWAVQDEAAALLPPLPATAPDWVREPRRCPELTSRLAELDLDDWSLTARDDICFPVRILVRKGRTPLGWIWSDVPGDVASFWKTLRDQVADNWGIALRLVRLARLTTPEASRPPISVVVCTRDRTDNLRRCLEALCRQDYPDYEIVIVDNAPATTATAELIAMMPDVRYVREDRPGLDWARNCGAAEARHPILAYTDDDTFADRHWLTGIAEAFADPGIDFVTGLVVPMKLDTFARLYFEDIYGGMGKGFDPVMRDPAGMRPDELLWANALGVGANMAFRKRVFDRAGRFDPALDVGTATRGGGDIEMFHRALAAGCRHLYQPSAFVWHEHRADFDGLGRQLADNGSGFASYLLAAWRNRTVPRTAILRFALRAWIFDWLIRRWLRPGRHRRDFVLAEIRGMLRGPKLWRAAQARARELAASGPGPT
ncbi:MAG: glycosyltransferase [Paracoccaceae bacterium]